MNAAAARIHLEASKRDRKKRRRAPESHVLQGMCSRLWNPERLRRAGQHCEHAGNSQRRRAIAAKLGGARYLSADAADIAERLVELIHGRSLYIVKLLPFGKLVNTDFLLR